MSVSVAISKHESNSALVDISSDTISLRNSFPRNVLCTTGVSAKRLAGKINDNTQKRRQADFM